MTAPLFGFAPFRMKSKAAAFYCGMSVSAFMRAVDEGKMPKGKKSEGGTYWLRAELENAMLPDTKKASGFGQRI